MYKVIANFFDMQDNNHAYKVGDTFPHNGIEVSEKRIESLAGINNRRKMPLIKKIESAVDKEVGAFIPASVEEPMVEEVKKPRRSRKK